MGKDWFLFIEGREEGPYYVEELLEDTRVNLDTLVWKEGLKDWTRLKEIRELVVQLNKKRKQKKDKSPPKRYQKIEKSELPSDEVIAIRSAPPPYIIWIILALLGIVYVFMQLT